MSSVAILIIVSILLVVLMIPVKSVRRWTTDTEGFLTPEIENPPPHLLLGSQSESEAAHRSDVYSRLATVRLDPYQ
jgi:hypothetical protein